MNIAEVSKAISCPTAAIEGCWPAISDALKSLNLYDRPTIIATLGTIAVETAWKFLPIREFGNDAYFARHYEGRADLGNLNKGDGVKFCGRGFIQITGRANYAKYGILLNVDLVGNPDLALTPSVAASILASYFSSRHIPAAAAVGDWAKVRRLVNGGNNGLDAFLNVVTKLQQLSEGDIVG